MEKAECCQEKIIHTDVVERVSQAMLPQQQFDDLSLLFKMFSDASRLKILKALFESEMCVCDLTHLLQMSQSAVSHQLASLKKTRLVRSRKVGKVVYYSLDDKHIEAIFEKALEHVLER